MNNRPEPKTAEEAIQMLDELYDKIQAEIRQEGADYYETIQNGKNSINDYEQTDQPPSSNMKVINVESENGKLHTEEGYQFLKSAMHQNSKFNINKPRLEDYNITQEMYENEIKKYREQKGLIKKGRVPSIISVLGFIFFAIIGLGVSGSLIGLVIGIGLWLFIMIKIEEKADKKYISSLSKIDSSIRESLIIQRYNKYSSDLKDYEAELAKFQKRIQMQREKYWIDMEGHRFEKEIATLFSKFGYDSKVTKGSGDGGVDIILIKNNKKYYVQCKNHKKPVAPATARDLFGAMSHDGIINGVIVSTMGFTKGVYKFVEGKNIKLISLKEILKMVDHIK